MSLVLGHQPRVRADDDADVIVAVRAFVIGTKETEEAAGGGADCHSQASGHWIVDTPIANPMSYSCDYKGSRRAWGINALGTIVVEVETKSGAIGVGISIGGEPACYIVEHHLSRFLIGQDPHCVELMWDQMFRASLNYGRKGLVIQAISAVDLAIWDALGLISGKPIYELLGGKTKGRLPVYATTARPDLAKKLGFQGGKFPLPYGPAEGDEGMRKNIERIQAVRASVGKDFPIMIDCYMSLTAPYAIELARRIDREVEGGVKWIEEFLPPDDYEGYAEVKRRVSTTLLTTGEHEYTRWGFRQLLEKKCADVLQPDITWCGGITEARRIVALASCYDIPVIPHGSSVYSYHLQYAFPSCPIAEFLILSPGGDKIVPLFGKTFTDEPLPAGGYIDLPRKPGFGVTLNRAELDLRRPFNGTLPRGMIAAAEADKDARTPTQSDWLARAAAIKTVPVSDEEMWAARAAVGGAEGATATEIAEGGAAAASASASSADGAASAAAAADTA